MTRLSIFPLLAALLFCIAGCGAKPERIVETYLQKLWAYDIAGAKAMCTGGARDALGNLHEDLATDRVFAAGDDEMGPEGRGSWEEFRSTFEITLYDKGSHAAVVFVDTPEEEILFTLTNAGGKWLISGITNPKFGLPGYKDMK